MSNNEKSSLHLFLALKKQKTVQDTTVARMQRETEDAEKRARRRAQIWYIDPSQISG